MSPRQKRSERRRGVRVVLGARDDAMLRAVARFRLVTSADFGDLFFDRRHRDVCASRLRRLYDAGYLETHVLDRAAPNIYSIGPQGKTWLREHGVEVHGLPRPPWQHHLSIVRLWVRVGVATHRLSRVRLARFTPEFEVRERGLGVALGLVPDALVDMAVTRNGGVDSVRMLVEVDRGTESLEVLRQKIRSLEAFRAVELVPHACRVLRLVVFLDQAGARREAKVRQLIAAEWKGPWHVWTDETDLRSELGSLAEETTRPVTASRRGNGRTSAASPTAASPPSVTGGEPSRE